MVYALMVVEPDGPLSRWNRFCLWPRLLLEESTLLKHLLKVSQGPASVARGDLFPDGLSSMVECDGLTTPI